MQIIQLDTQIYVGPQIWASDMATLNRMKIGTIIVARPEGETADQPTISAIREAADTFGIAIHQLPIVPGNITDDDVRAYSAITTKAEGPVLAYCRSGMRAASLWALGAVRQGQTPDEILRIATNVNFDLSALAPRLAAIAA